MMKKLLVALALFPLAARAEVTAGTFELTGGSNLGFRSGSVKYENWGAPVSQTSDTSQFGLDVGGIYYVTPNVGIGLRLGYSDDSEKLNGITTSVTAFGIGPEVIYEAPVAEKVSLFGLGFLGYASATRSETGNPDQSGSGVAFELAAGAKYFPVKSLSFNAALAYDYRKLTFDSVGGLTPRTTDSGLGLALGLSVYFGGAGH